jgi:hypothetical protein
LDYLGSYRQATARDASRRKGRRRNAFIHGLDVPFTICCTQSGKILKILSTLGFVSTKDQEGNGNGPIFIRPGGTSAVNDETFGPNTLYFEYRIHNFDVYKPHIGSDNIIRMAIGRIPGSLDRRPCYGMYVYASSPRVWLVDRVMLPVAFEFPPEATDILLGVPPAPTNIEDLHVVESLRQGKKYNPASSRIRKKGKNAEGSPALLALPQPPQDVVDQWRAVSRSTKLHVRR